MFRRNASIPTIIFFILFVSVWNALACTSFMLKTSQGLFFVHSLNQGNVPRVMGSVVINQRNVWKKGYSWDNLIKMDADVQPNLIWKSTYGSVTFNPFGKELIDGGMNEAGLYIWEMNFDTQYPDDPTKPKLFQCQWMQYVLDNFDSVDDVIENAGRMSIDGWGWHYFVADKSGKTAIIDFIDGKPVVYTGDSMPVPICCNSHYPEALKWLHLHQGFGGELKSEKIYQEIPRFVHGADLLKKYTNQDPVEYSFNMLEEMSENVRWSVVIDVSNLTVYFSTNLNKDIRSFTLTSGDFVRKDGLLMLDIDYPGPGDVRSQFTSYNPEMDQKYLTDFFELIRSNPDYWQTIVQGRDIGMDTIIQTMMEKLSWTESPANEKLTGHWAGTVAYPTPDGQMELPVTLVLNDAGNRLTGKMNDNTLIKNLPISNVAFRGGLLTFSIKDPDYRDVIYFQLYHSLDGMKGYGKVWHQKKKAILSLEQKQ